MSCDSLIVSRKHRIRRVTRCKEECLNAQDIAKIRDLRSVCEFEEAEICSRLREIFGKYSSAVSLDMKCTQSAFLEWHFSILYYLYDGHPWDKICIQYLSHNKLAKAHSCTSFLVFCSRC